MSEPLVCPSCALTYGLDERFCAKCGMPLVYTGAALDEGAPITDRHERARKIKPQLAEGELVRVAGARNQAEAEFIQGLLLEEGVPSISRRTAGFDVPDFLAGGPRDVMVPASGVVTAREILLEAELVSDGPVPTGPSPLKLVLGLLAGLLVLAVIVLVANALGS
jgi:hypothetical protein